MESKLQGKIRVDLEKSGWVVHKVVRSSRPGWPDQEAFRNKIAIFVEVKDEGEEPEDLQKHRHKLLRDQGFDVFVVDTYDQWLEIRKNNYL